MVYVFFNKKSNSGDNDIKTCIDKLEKEFNNKVELIEDDGLEYDKYPLKKDDKLVIAGGDGTLNYLVNHVDISKLPYSIYLLPYGTGNDFANDTKGYVDNHGLIYLNDKLASLPTIEVKDKHYHFVNGIGFGIDGECCVEAEKLKEKGETNLNYASITVNLLLKSYKPRKCKVIIDGEELEFKKVYLASCMYGRYYGGGMKVAPNQVRGNNVLSFVTVYGKGKFGTLVMFPSIFKGEHVKYKKNTFIKTGKEIEVIFDKPCGLQIDGEVINDVTSYKVHF